LDKFSLVGALWLFPRPIPKALRRNISNPGRPPACCNRIGKVADFGDAH
jgi:hypothetical protein